jgi:hypothetical protein
MSSSKNNEEKNPSQTVMSPVINSSVNNESKTFQKMAKNISSQ